MVVELDTAFVISEKGRISRERLNLDCDVFDLPFHRLMYPEEEQVRDTLHRRKVMQRARRIESRFR